MNFIASVYLWSIVFVVVGLLILVRNPKDMAKNTPLDYIGFTIALIGGLPIWVGLLLFMVVVLLVTMGLWELRDADF